MVKFGVKVRTWDSLPMPNLILKNCLRDILLKGKFIPKIANLGEFVAFNRTF